MTVGIPWTMHASGDGWRGKGRIWNREKLIRKHEATEQDRTCPQYFAGSPFFLSLMEQWGDYRNGRLGNVKRNLSIAVLTYLRVFNSEWDLWDSHWMAKLS